MLGFGILDYIKIGAGLIVGAFVVWLGYTVVVIPWKQHVARQEGRQEIVQQVTKRNQQAGQLAREAKQGVDACYDANGTWDQEAGRCVLPAQ